MILRPWREKDAAALYKYAKDPKVGPNAGWPIHTSVENSRENLKDVLMQEECFAVVLKGETEPVGSIGLLIKAENNLAISLAEGKISYWIGVPGVHILMAMKNRNGCRKNADSFFVTQNMRRSFRG